MIPESEIRIKEILNEVRLNAYNDGKAVGKQVAERILVWFLANPKLKEPHSIETLELWSRTAMEELNAS